MAIQPRDFERLMNQARVKLPGASDAGLKGELFDVIDEFVSDSNTWDEWITLPIVSGLQDYSVTPAHGGAILRMVTIFDQNSIVVPAFITELYPPGANIHLVWPQSTNYSANAVFIKKVVLPNNRDDIPEAPSWLFPIYGRYVLDGLLGKMMTQPTKSYSNDSQGTYHLRRFRDGISMAKVAKERGNLKGGQAWRFPNQFRSNSQRGGVSTPFPTPSSWGGV